MKQEKSFTRKLLLMLGALIFLSPIIYFEFVKSCRIEKYSSTYVIFWAVVNLATAYSISEMGRSYFRVLGLEELNMNKFALIAHLAIICIFLLMANCYFIYEIYGVRSDILRILGNQWAFLVIIVLFIVITSFGRMPELAENNGIRVFTLRPVKFGLMGGNERFGCHIGSFKDGFVVGTYSFFYDGVRTINKAKDGVLVIKGEDADGKYVINVSAPKSKKALEDIFKSEKTKALKAINIKF